MAASNTSSVKDFIEQATVSSRSSTPYRKWSSLTVKIISMRKSRKCTAFDFSGAVVSVGKEKMTLSFGAADDTGFIKITADEKTVADIGVSIEEGKTYMLKNFGVLSGTNVASVQLYLRPNSKVFRVGQLSIPSELAEKAKKLLHPQSPVKSRLTELNSTDLFTVQGRISTVSAVRRIETRDGPIPIRDLELCCQDGSRLPVSLWREAALEDVSTNMSVSISHCRVSSNPSFGVKASSTQYTEIQEIAVTTNKITITINGLAVTKEENVLISTSQEGEMSTSVDILKQMVPGVDIEDIYELLPLKVSVMVEGENILGVDHCMSGDTY